MLSPSVYHYPPRPEMACAPQQIALYEQDGWWLQAKLNGTCVIVSVAAKGPFVINARHGSALTKWSATPAHVEAFRALCSVPDALYVFVGELMFGRVVAPHLSLVPIYLHDILVEADQSLIGQTYEQRLKRLTAIVATTSEPTASHTVINDYLWFTRTYTSGLASVYPDLERRRRWFPEYEGIVLKKPTARLRPCDRDGANSSWQIKSRFPRDAGGEMRQSF